MSRIVVVGSSLAGVAATEELRSRGFDGELVLIGEESEYPYDRPPLSKEVLRGAAAEECRLRPLDWHDELDVDLRLGCEAVGLDPKERTLSLAGGDSLAFDGLVIATGAAARALPGPAPEGVITLRTLADSLALRAALEQGRELAVVGGGFIGAEVASTARELGLAVTIIETLPTPLSRILGNEAGSIFARLYADHDIGLRCGTPVVDIEGEHRVERVRLADGSSVPADIVVVGVGAKPNTEWLASSGLKLADGVVCDASCRTAVPWIVAAGDVARWNHPRLGSVRIEHWDNAVAQGHSAAASLLDPEQRIEFDPVPYVWSDQCGHKIQMVGRPLPDDEFVVVDGDPAAYRFTAVYGRHGRLSAGLAFNGRAAIRRMRRLLAEGAGFEAAQSALRAAAAAAKTSTTDNDS